MRIFKLLAEDMIEYVENPRQFKGKLIENFKKVPGYRSNIKVELVITN